MVKNNLEENIIENKLKIKIIGVGGAGNNVIDDFEIQKSQLENVQLFLVNTDSRHLQSKQNSNATKIAFGKSLTEGNGAGANPETGRQAFKEDKEKFEKIFEDTDIVFTVFGLGKGTGSGAGPEISRLAKEKGILSIAIAILPFKTMGGATQAAIAETELSTIDEKCDSYLLFSNDNILNSAESNELSILNKEICKSIQTVIDIIFLPAIINLDFADIKTKLTNKGLTIIGMGSGAGTEKESDAVRQAVESHFFDGSIQDAKSILVHVVSAKKNNSRILDNVIREIKTSALSSGDLDIVFGLTEDDSLSDEIFIRIIVNDFPSSKETIKIKETKKVSNSKQKDLFTSTTKSSFDKTLLNEKSKIFSKTTEEEVTPIDFEQEQENLFEDE